MSDYTNILDLIAASGPQGGAMPPEQRAVRVWAIELVKDRWGLYSTPEQMVNAAWLVVQQATGTAIPLINGAVDAAKLPIPSAGLPKASYPPPTATTTP